MTVAAVACGDVHAARGGRLRIHDVGEVRRGIQEAVADKFPGMRVVIRLARVGLDVSAGMTSQPGAPATAL